MLVEMSAIEESQREFIGWKMRGNPVHHHTDAALMQTIDQVHKVLRCAVPAGRREISRALVSPGSIEGMLHERQELHVCEPQSAHIVRQRLGDLAVAHGAIAFFRYSPP